MFELIYSYLLVAITVFFSLQTTTQNCSKYFFLFFTCRNLVQSIVLPAPLGFYICLTWHVWNRRKKILLSHKCSASLFRAFLVSDNFEAFSWWGNVWKMLFIVLNVFAQNRIVLLKKFDHIFFFVSILVLTFKNGLFKKFQ